MSEAESNILGKDIEIINGFAFKSVNFLNETTNDAYPVIKIKNVANGDVHLNGTQFHKYEKNLSRYVVEQGDILIALTGNHPQAITQVVGQVSRFKLNIKALLNQRVAKIIPKNDLDIDYLYYFLKDENTHNYLANQSTGSANQANISKTDIENIPVELPEPNIQKTISSILSSLDSKIDLLQTQNKTLDELSELLFRQWFVEEPKEEWSSLPLSKIADFLNGLACQKFPPKNEVDKLPVLKIKELSSGITVNSDWASTEIKPEYIVRNGDVIFAWSASLMVKIWEGQDCILNQHLFKVTSADYPKWFFYLWCKHHLKEFISIAASHATTMGHIKRGDLDDAKVLIPSPKEFAEMNEQAEPLIQKIIANNSQINTLIKLRDSLLPKLMSGEVTVEI